MRAQTCKDHRFRDLYRELDAGLLHLCWRDLNRTAASGVDRVTAQAYAQDLGANLRDLAARKKLQSAKRRIKGWVKANRHLSGRHFVRQLNRKLVGHYNYFGLRSNEKALHSFYQWTIGCAFKWLNRRGGKRRSFTWGQFNAALKQLGVALPRVTEQRREHVASVV